MIGTLIDCRDGAIREIELEYEIVGTGDERIFQLINGTGITGYESFYIFSKYVPLAKILSNGWMACAGTEGVYDRLIISGKEMSKALGGILK